MSRAKHFVKSMISGLPGPLSIRAWDAIWSVKSPQFRAQRAIQRAMYDRIGRPSHVLGGPFAGMRYIERATGSAYLPKIVGTYELELAPALESIIRWNPDVLIDIGSAEGYYAVGLALRLPSLRVLAYDVYKPARFLTRTLAQRNAVQARIEIRNRCTAARLEADVQAATRPLVICDCEGYEDDVLQPGLGSPLAKAMLLVELHEMFKPGVTGRIRSRFEASHDVQMLCTATRDPSMLPHTIQVSAEESMELMNERRAEPMQWFFMRPRSMPRDRS